MHLIGLDTENHESQIRFFKKEIAINPIAVL
jgi:hypothetical protein